ncbi:hypothetical protein NMQ03_08810 [Arthrobacter sp. DNA4]|uniref:hypothetical protein n=1 Tax=Arthrobacter sp. DNA4 TaxID=2963432 RepID=UPI0020CE25A3|nr:hypothetical protein [Arthrobacter sp. DNA4]UTT71673.1 hypothetical protein NMQ03_08810 [Arthrobacter sp. DNA4]
MPPTGSISYINNSTSETNGYIEHLHANVLQPERTAAPAPVRTMNSTASLDGGPHGRTGINDRG